MVKPISATAPSHTTIVRPLPSQAAAAISDPQAVATRDSLRLSRPNLAAKQFVLPKHSDGWKDLGEMVSTFVYSPIASVVGGVAGFFMGGPVGAAIGASVGGTALGLFFAGKNVAHHLGHVLRKEESDGGQHLKLAGMLMIVPGTTLAGAGIGFALGGPIGAAIGGAVGSAAIPLGAFVTSIFQRLFGPKPETQPPAQPE